MNIDNDYFITIGQTQELRHQVYESSRISKTFVWNLSCDTNNPCSSLLCCSIEQTKFRFYVELFVFFPSILLLIADVRTYIYANCRCLEWKKSILYTMFHAEYCSVCGHLLNWSYMLRYALFQKKIAVKERYFRDHYDADGVMITTKSLFSFIVEIS